MYEEEIHFAKLLLNQSAQLTQWPWPLTQWL